MLCWGLEHRRPEVGLSCLCPEACPVVSSNRELNIIWPYVKKQNIYIYIDIDICKVRVSEVFQLNFLGLFLRLFAFILKIDLHPCFTVGIHIYIYIYISHIFTYIYIYTYKAAYMIYYHVNLGIHGGCLCCFLEKYHPEEPSTPTLQIFGVWYTEPEYL